MMWYLGADGRRSVKKEIAILASVAFGSMAVGFVIVLLVLGPGERNTLPDPFPGGEAATGSQAPSGEAAKEKPAVAPAKAAAPAAKAVDPAPVPEPELPVAVDPAPAGELALAVGDPFIWRCWAEGQDEPLEKERCGVLAGADKLVSDNLGLIEQCVLDSAGSSAAGKLSLALKIDFSSGRVKAWLGNSTTVESMEAISGCLRAAFEDKTPPAIAHDYPRYIVFFTITVG